MTNQLSSRKRRAIEVFTTAIAVVGAWFLPHGPLWFLIALAVGLILLFGVVWWRLRDK